MRDCERGVSISKRKRESSRSSCYPRSGHTNLPLSLSLSFLPIVQIDTHERPSERKRGDTSEIRAAQGHVGYLRTSGRCAYIYTRARGREMNQSTRRVWRARVSSELHRTPALYIHTHSLSFSSTIDSSPSQFIFASANIYKRRGPRKYGSVTPALDAAFR